MFSLPSTSIGSVEADEYLRCRCAGKSQQSSSEVFFKKGMGLRYGIRFEKRIFRIIQIAAALVVLPAYQINPSLFEILNGENVQINRVNSECNILGLNPLFFSRKNILTVRENKLGKGLALNPGAIWSSIPYVNSS